MKRQILTALILLVFVVFLSGCVGQVPGVPGAATGVIIKSFSPDISEIYSGDSVVFSLAVENVGEEDATNVQAKLFGLGTGWTGWSTAYDDVNPSTLLKSQPEYKIPGGMGDAQWEPTSPTLRVDNTYTASVRLKYDYVTSAHGDIKVYTQDYLKTRPEEAESIMKSPGIASFSVSKAPVTVSLTGVARPLVTSPGKTASIAVLISNIGQGAPFKNTENDMTITIDSIKVGDTTCVSGVDKRLPRGGQGSASCSFKIPDFTDYSTVPIDVQLSYSYFVDASTTIKVLKTLEVGVTPTPTWSCDDEDTCDTVDDCAPPPVGYEVACRSYTGCTGDRCCCYRET